MVDVHRTERLAGAARLWGAIAMFHPYVVSRRIDWDAALVDSLPALRDASEAESYKAAISRLLSHLDDPATTVSEFADSSWPGGSTSQRDDPPVVCFVDGAVGRVGILATKGLNALAPVVLMTSLAESMTQLESADAVVIDTRGGGDALRYYGADHLRALFDGEVVRPAARTRIHVGHAPDAGGSEMYYSGFVVPEGKVIAGRGGALAAKPLVFVLDDTAVFSDQAFALQAAGRAKVVWVGTFHDLADADDIPLPHDLIVRMRTAEWLAPDGTVGLCPDLVIDADAETERAAYESSAAIRAAATLLSSADDRPERSQRSEPLSPRPGHTVVPDEWYPSVDERLLALFRYWNIIDHHFPYAHLMDRDWDDVLLEFIPKVEAAENATDYALALAECNAHIQDTHGVLYSAAFSEWVGALAPDVSLRLVEGVSVVVRVGESADGLAVGDVVLSVDGQPTQQRRAALAPFIAASTPHALEWRVHNLLLNGPQGTTASLEVETAGGERRQVGVQRTVPYAAPPVRTGPIFEVLPSGYGYVDLARLTVEQAEAAFVTIRSAPGLILDMRGYPNGTARAVAAWFARERTLAAKFTKPIPRHPGRAIRTTESIDQFLDPRPDKQRYGGKVVTLIHGESISQAEHTCLFIEAATEGAVTFVGSPTNGANGDVTSIALPGGIRTMFSGHDVRHADGRQLQRTGIQPHVHAEPTIAGIRSGRDEVLAAAVAFLDAGGR